MVWSRIYTTDYKPTAADVGAWSKTEADGRFVKQAGDTMTGALTLPRVVFPNEGLQASNADSDLTRPDGFTLEQLGDKSVGYPLTKGNLGNLMTFKLNKYRHVQFAIGSGNTEFCYAHRAKIIRRRLRLGRRCIRLTTNRRRLTLAR